MRDQIIAVMVVTLLALMVAWQTSDTREWRKENLRLRREIARLSKHPSTYEPEPLPYMRRYADDE
ncbi:hypothetical protein PROPHIGD91-2_20 [Mycobacterium phage prophiGD91-2]|uniref:hypothetical protein n=1 Tax=Mycobacteroides abscessus TaxID=36809 RepID=UPI00092A9607|nr:hypothetical protein [Mycobacteroides abscessus]QSM03877.1 hypothetical protein PROPHIGD91-2_20 [Mycobacterium phage prophiGD91-2]QSM92022.1 hypothetical protein I3U44_07440 [Mycobacteroides abscessus subsp. bolletii]QSM92025.1 hypothetical protein I3U44_09085 [Mycobacteroides abscessus subsp. bolletii]SIJ02396.1 Uncharacterised protein [Mycobacteroides abscessus subsp. bolletii]SLD37514.1 Uncharacterised protein [Mycobacteroides abscessus subsp. bolletii]